MLVFKGVNGMFGDFQHPIFQGISYQMIEKMIMYLLLKPWYFSSIFHVLVFRWVVNSDRSLGVPKWLICNLKIMVSQSRLVHLLLQGLKKISGEAEI